MLRHFGNTLNPPLRRIAVTISLAALAVPAAWASAADPAASDCTVTSIAGILKEDPLIKILDVRAFAKGDRLEQRQDETGPKALNDLCRVKLLRGPGTPGPAGAPSTQAGVGMEIWLPVPGNWNGRIHNVGGGGFMGIREITDPARVAPAGSQIIPAAQIAGTEGAVSAITDTGHVGQGQRTQYDGSFLMTTSGAINTEQWKDFSEQGIHQTAVVSKRLANGFYGQPARQAYFEGCSTGGRQALKHAQMFPDDYDGIIAGAPAINWTRFITADLYPQVLMQQDLGKPLSPAQLEKVSAAAVSACDRAEDGRHLGYIPDPSGCHYDPVQDQSLLCQSNGGADSSTTCLSRVQAEAVNKMWFGQTADGIAPDPAAGNGQTASLAQGQLWFGPARGAKLAAGVAGSRDGQAAAFPIAAHQVALNLQDSTLATPNFVNAKGNGVDGWKRLSYADLARAYQQGLAFQAEFAHINTDTPNLDAFRARGGKLLSFHGLADPVIPVGGTLRYYNEVVEHSGGLKATERFYRLYTVPGMGHCGGIGSADGIGGVSPKADPPLPRSQQLYGELVKWVEKDQPPSAIKIANASGSVVHPLCKYPQQLRVKRGDTNTQGASCQ